MDPRRDPRADALREELASALMETIHQFFEDRLRPGPASPLDGADPRLRLATAVLLIEMTRADFEVGEEERAALIEAIERAFGLGREETAEIVRLAEAEVRQSVPLHAFTRLIDGHFSLEQKKRVVELLWEVAFADAELLAHEEYLVRKVSEQLHLPLADFVEAKIRARDRFR